jgi:uncharacterized protein affecting Mg2+/Co2+ transport
MEDLSRTLEQLNIKYFKLMSGESIIAYVHDLDHEVHGAMVALEEPMTVKVSSKDEYTFTPWFPFTTGKVHMLDTYNILAEDTVDNHIKAYYMKIVLRGVEPDISDPDIEWPSDDDSGTIH